MSLLWARLQAINQPPHHRAGLLATCALSVSLCSFPALALHPDKDLTELSLEQLKKIDVRLTARRGESLRESPAAVYVLSHEAIQRSGATSIPELLRLVPGVEVTRFSGSKWGVGIRGFNGGLFTNRLLILVDGRSVFSPAKVGMFWDTLDTYIPDIDRIEVVRGPGASLWGSNAFNGVINIVTRSSRDTAGGLVELGAGNEEKWFAGGRYGIALANDAALRGYAKHFDRDASISPKGETLNDPWQGSQLGLRYDGAFDNASTASFQFNAYEGKQTEELNLPDASSPNLGSRLQGDVRYSGMNALALLQQPLSDNSRASLRFSIDHSEREDLFFDLNITSYDIDFQHDVRFSSKSHLIWGLAYRYTQDKLKDSYIRFDPISRDYDVLSAFAQYEYKLGKNISAFAGTKIEYNDFTHTELQPNLRALWSPEHYGSFWASVSKANRTPSRTEHDSIIDFDFINPNVQLQIRGDEAFESEELLAQELGWRKALGDRFSVDIALFYNEYEGLRTLEPGSLEPSPTPPPAFVVPLFASNGADARSWGGELVVNAIWSPRWRTELHYSQVQIHVDPLESADTNAENAEGESPLHRATLRSFWDLPGHIELNATVRYSDEVERQNIDAYTELDLVVSKRIGKHFTVSLVGQNLLDNGHEEFVDRVVGTPRSEVERSAFVKLTISF